MKILTLHCDYIKFQPLKKALNKAEDLADTKEKEVKECLVVLTAIEKGDNSETLSQLINAVKKTAKEVNSNNIVLYPYAHLSSNLASPETALSLLIEAEKILKNDFRVVRAPFGYYKTFELKCKGHPLSELSKEFKSTEKEIGEIYDEKQLLKEISRSKLDTSKLKENDHRILGQKLDLFSFNEVAPGQPFWHPNGQIIWNELSKFVREINEKFNYKEISTPYILNNNLWKISGHWEHYKNNMFITEFENKQAGVKPMNCPGMMLIYKTKTRSYKDLPLRLFEFGTVHRKELSGVLAGLLRVVKITQDDAHIFCEKEQIEQEINSIMDIIKIIYKDTFGFSYRMELSTRPEKFLGEKKVWDDAEKSLENALKKKKINYKLNKGDGAFYGPKIDLHVKDSLGREWQCSTIQLDMQMPARFDLEYTGKNNKIQTPIVIHRAVLGSLERFIGILLEHTNGALPLWLSPIQVRIINFTDRNTKAVEKLEKEIKNKIPELRTDTDLESTTLNDKIRKAEMQKIPYIIVLGDKEEENKTLAVRERGQKPKFGIKTEKFIEEIMERIESKS